MNIMLHIPHSSVNIPLEYKNLFYLNPTELLQEQLKMVDLYTDDLFNIENLETLIFPICRLICDVERFRNEKEEIMTKQGMWVCYTKTSNFETLKEVTTSHKKEILEKYYDKHHKTFSKMVKKILKTNLNCLIIDCHSFSSKSLPYELCKNIERPDICIGTDSFHTPRQLQDRVVKSFEKLRYNVNVNAPFAGTIVPLKFYQKRKNVYSIMIEINRNLYMDEKTGEKTENYLKIKGDIKKIINSLKKFSCF